MYSIVYMLLQVMMSYGKIACHGKFDVVFVTKGIVNYITFTD